MWYRFSIFTIHIEFECRALCARFINSNFIRLTNENDRTQNNNKMKIIFCSFLFGHFLALSLFNSLCALPRNFIFFIALHKSCRWENSFKCGGATFIQIALVFRFKFPMKKCNIFFFFFFRETKFPCKTHNILREIKFDS